MGSLFRAVKESKPFKKADLLIIPLLMLASALAIFLLSPGGGSYAEIYADGKLVRVMPLDVDAEFVYHFDEGRKNVITVKGGKVSVSYADCADKICTHYPPTDRASSSIICLPHKLVIIVRGGENEYDGVV
ncbi:MAG: NusG domain II-containing protein [Clostridiales bacterium]|jgi:hypothetical protein|nr:NusG domain II-containing protein [Clostridiales bacterium]